MILACPNCKTNFNVPTGAVPENGRKVRCASCQHSWHAMPDMAIQVEPVVARPFANTLNSPDPELRDTLSQLRSDVYSEPYSERDDYSSRDDNFDRDETPSEEDLSAGLESFLRAAVDENDRSDELSQSGHFESDRPDLAREEFDEYPDDDDDYDDEEDDFEEDDDVFFDEDADDLNDFDDEEELEDGEGQIDQGLSTPEDIIRMRARQRREEDREKAGKRKTFKNILWAVLLIIWIAIPIAIFGFAEDVKKLWPASQVIFDLLEDLKPENQLRSTVDQLSPAITDQPEIVNALLEPTIVEVRDGVPALIIRGFVENAGQRSARVPKLRIALFDAAGQVIDSWVFDPPGLLITRGQKLNFEQIKSPIPPGANQAAVEVVKGVYSETEAVG